MIIRHPTGLYTSVLPSSPDDAGDVTFTISNSAPPRTSLSFSKLPPGIAMRKRDPKTIDSLTRRAGVDVLLFTVQKTGRSADESGIKRYEVGQLLDFTDLQPVRSLDQNLAGTYSEMRHDTGLLDYDKLGFTAEQQAVVESESDMMYRRFEIDLGTSRAAYSALQVGIIDNQKLMTETTKAFDALVAMGSVDPVIVKMITDLMIRKSDLNSERGRLVNAANDESKRAASILAKLRSLAQLVR